AEHDRDAVRAEALELRQEVPGGQRGAPAELDDVHAVARDLDETVDVRKGEPAVEDVGQPRRPGLAAARREIERPGHASSARRYRAKFCPTTTTTSALGPAVVLSTSLAATTWEAGTRRDRAASSASSRWPAVNSTLVSDCAWLDASVTATVVKPCSSSRFATLRASPVTVVPFRTATLVCARWAFVLAGGAPGLDGWAAGDGAWPSVFGAGGVFCSPPSPATTRAITAAPIARTATATPAATMARRPAKRPGAPSSRRAAGAGRGGSLGRRVGGGRLRALVGLALLGLGLLADLLLRRGLRLRALARRRRLGLGLGRRGRRLRGDGRRLGGLGLRRAVARRRLPGGGGRLRRRAGQGLPLDAPLRVGRHALLELGGALGRSPGPLAQPAHLARLAEVEEREDGEAGDRDEPGEGADRLEVLVDLDQGMEKREHAGGEAESRRGRRLKPRMSTSAARTARSPCGRAPPRHPRGR